MKNRLAAAFLLALGEPIVHHARVGVRCVECETSAERELLPWLREGGACPCGGQQIYARPGESPERWQARRAERRG